MEFDLEHKDKLARLASVAPLLAGKWVDKTEIVKLLQLLIHSGDRVCLEGNNQKQAKFLARSLAQVDPSVVNNLHIVQSALSLPEHISVFEKGLASRVDFCYSSGQGARLAQLAASGKITIGGIHTYLELFARYFMDLTPKVALVIAAQADHAGNLYTGPNTEDTPAIIEATAFRNGIVIAEVFEVVDVLPRVDIPASWVDVVVHSPLPMVLNPLFTRDPAKIDELKILMAMLVIKGIYAKYGVNRLNHGVGFNTCAIELLLPTYAESLGLKGKICQNLVINPVPTLIPAIEAGFVKTICSPGGEVGMNEYVKAHPDIFFNGLDGSQRSNRAFAQLAGLYAIDLFIGATLQIDLQGNSSTATLERITGFGGAPNLGSDVNARRHATPTWLQAGKESAESQNKPFLRGRKLVVQMVDTFQAAGVATFVEKLDAWALQEKMNLPLPPIMILGDDVTHVVTEEGIANLMLCRNADEREQAIRGVAGYTPVGLARDQVMVNLLRERGAIQYPEDLGINYRDASRDLLAAKTIKDLVNISGGLYQPPSSFRDW
ncbi:MAG: malonate decarboxylase subunit alpha [Burkholderiales bacterium]|nr:malonate decarboxylase subunit alpha [Burkholderiales bacterium]